MHLLFHGTPHVAVTETDVTGNEIVTETDCQAMRKHF